MTVQGPTLEHFHQNEFLQLDVHPACKFYLVHFRVLISLIHIKTD